jgi:hypothetical protein
MTPVLAHCACAVFLHQRGKLWDLLLVEADAAAPLSPKGKTSRPRPAGEVLAVVIRCRSVTHVVGARSHDPR